LKTRQILALDPQRAIAIKRDVRTFDVAVGHPLDHTVDQVVADDRRLTQAAPGGRPLSLGRSLAPLVLEANKTTTPA